jgi:hypothetical protein
MINVHHRGAAVVVAAMLALTACAPGVAADQPGTTQSLPSQTTSPVTDATPSTTMGQTTDPAVIQAQVGLYNAMRELWSEHMQWTFATVDAFFHNQEGLQSQLDRLLVNQADIGAAIEPFYGQDAADQLTDLLTTHINQAVPVLTAAQDGDNVALDVALADWYANAEEIADFVSSANPENWPQSATRPMLKGHIDTTTVYATDLLKGDYTSAIIHYDEASHHMMMLADTLSAGIIAQFPEQFGG